MTGFENGFLATAIVSALLVVAAGLLLSDRRRADSDTPVLLH